MQEKSLKKYNSEVQKNVNSQNSFETLDKEVFLDSRASEGNLLTNIGNAQKIVENHSEQAFLSIEEAETITDLSQKRISIFQKLFMLKEILKSIMVLLALIVVSYFLMTAPAQLTKLNYFFDNLGEQPVAQATEKIASLSFSQAISSALHQGKFNAPKTQELKKLITKPAGLINNHLVIPKIKIITPIIWNSGTNEKAMIDSLQRGVAHYSFTSIPNDKSGNVFITGHSSNYWWDKGEYNTVFALLDKLKMGDNAYIQYKDKIYVYKMIRSTTIKPSNLTITNETKKPTLSLMTCTPVGTSLNRLIVQFDLIGVYTP